MHRTAQLDWVRQNAKVDIAVIGGGATGAGIALDAALRGYRTVLFEAGDFGRGTSSRSTKLIHGGVRYLEQGHIGLVREALHERALLLRNAPGLVKPLAFVLPLYGMLDRFYYGTGLFLYDRLAGAYGSGLSSEWLNRAETIRRLPTVRQEGLRGGWLYHDAQFDDARLLIEIIKAAAAAGAAVVNYAPVEALLRDSAERIRGVAFQDLETGNTAEVEASVVINAAGPFADSVRRMGGTESAGSLAPSQGAHIVLDASFLPSRDALLIPKTPDGRVLFVIPWLGKTLVGTTDTAVERASFEPRPLAAEIDFLLETAAGYLDRRPQKTDILSAWAGIRPLVATGSGNTAALSRDHSIVVDANGLVTISGGKWTTYRRMAQQCVDAAAHGAGLPVRPSSTEQVQFACSDGALDPVTRAAREEMARSVEDVLARRTRLLFLDARAAIEAAPRTAAALAAELGRDAGWQAAQVDAFTQIASGYLPA